MTKTRKKMKQSDQDVLKVMNIRMPYDMWKFLKQTSLDEEVSINQIVINLLNKYHDKRASA